MERAGGPLAGVDAVTQDLGQLFVGRYVGTVINCHEINVSQTRPELTSGYFWAGLL